MKKIIFLMLPFMMTNLHAGQGGNGGDVIICPDKKNLLLDIYQGLEDNFHPSLRENESDTIITMLKEFSSRIEEHDPARANKMLSEMIHLALEIEKAQKNESKFVKFTDDELKDIEDSEELFIPTGCKKEQLIIQLSKENRDVYGLKYRINRSFWEAIDDEQKAFTISHEILLGEAIKNGHEDSRKIREFNYLVGDNAFTRDFKKSQYIEKLMTHFELPYSIENSTLSFEFKPSSFKKMNEYIFRNAWSSGDSFRELWVLDFDLNRIDGYINKEHLIKKMMKPINGNMKFAPTSYYNSSTIFFEFDLEEGILTIFKSLGVSTKIKYVQMNGKKYKKFNSVKIKENKIIEIVKK